MKTRLIILLLATIVCLPAAATRKTKADKDTHNFRYEIECAGNGIQGTYLIKVWSFSKSAKIATEQCKKNAVHGVIFKGYGGGNGCVQQRAIANKPGAELENEEYFRLFFKDNGEYMKYVTMTSTPQETVKIGREYKVGVIVSVKKDELRKALEAAGVVRGLSSGF